MERSKNKYVRYLQDLEVGLTNEVNWLGLPSYDNEEADFLQIVKEINDIIDWHIAQLDVITNIAVESLYKLRIDHMSWIKHIFISEWSEENNE